MASAEDKAKLKAKNKKVLDKVKEIAPAGGRFSVRTRHGEVAFEDLRTKDDVEGVEFLDIHLAGDTSGGEDHWRIYNPPTWVQDYNGPITGRDGVTRFREDPITAVAEVIAGAGDRQKGRRPA